MGEKWVSTPQGRHLKGRRSQDTEPELRLRHVLHARGGRYRLHTRLAKGCTPDLVLPSRRLAVFVDGCWWHSCPVHGRKTAFTGPNAELWTAKMARIRERDARAGQIARDQGWTVCRLWECEIHADVDRCVDDILGCVRV